MSTQIDSTEQAHRCQRALAAIGLSNAGHPQRTRHDDPKCSALFKDVTLNFAHGRCAWFALAASAKYDLPLVALVDDTGKMVHVLCRAGERYLDAYGLGEEGEVFHAFTHMMGRRVREDGRLRLFETNEAVVRHAFELQGPEHDAEIADTTAVVERLVKTLGLKVQAPPVTSAPRRRM